MSGFAEWWRGKVTRDAREALWSREALVLVVANEDGGAHIDPAMSENYHALTRENAMGWRFHAAGTNDDGMPFTNGPVLASIRQIAWELEWTLRLFMWKDLQLDGPQAHKFRPPDSDPTDERWQKGQLELMPSTSFRVTVDGGPNGKRLTLRHPPNFVLSVTPGPSRVPDSA